LPIRPRIAKTVATTQTISGYAFGVNEVEAKEACERLAAEHPDRHTHRWVATKRGDEWAVAKIGLPPTSANTTPEQRADERPLTPDAPPNADTLKNWVFGGLG
jgi:hypothetical protein